MKKATLLFIAVCVSALGFSQVTAPQASTSSTLQEMIGLTQVEVKYSRPNKNQRTIFGNVVPYGQIWRTGANANTTIEFSDDVIIGGQTLKAGKYAIFTKPEQKQWEVYFYSENDNWGNQVKWDESKVSAKTTAEVNYLPFSTETFTIAIEDIRMDRGALTFRWENTYVPVEIVVPTDAKTMASIEKTMAGGDAKAQDYISAANYYFQAGKDMKQAKEWIDKGISMMETAPYYFLYSQAAISEKAGDKQAAVQISKKSLEAAEKAGDQAYIRQNEELLKRLGN